MLLTDLRVRLTRSVPAVITTRQVPFFPYAQLFTSQEDELLAVMADVSLDRPEEPTDSTEG